MGAIELQVFVSLVVILGAAFVALICDFLKGNNEQLREANIELRVRQDEREKRQEIIERVQKQTLDVVVQAQRMANPRAVQAVNASLTQATQTQPVGRVHPPAPAAQPQEVDTRELFERAQRERSSRSRRRQARPTAEPAASPRSEGATWAEEVFLRRYPHPAPAAAAVDAPAPVEPATAPIPELVEPVAAPVREAAPIRDPELEPPALEPKELVPQSALETTPVAPAAHPYLQPAEATLASAQAALPVLAGESRPVALGHSTTMAPLESGPALMATAQPQPLAPIQAEFEAQVPHAPIPVDALTEPALVEPAMVEPAMVEPAMMAPLESGPAQMATAQPQPLAPIQAEFGTQVPHAPILVNALTEPAMVEPAVAAEAPQSAEWMPAAFDDADVVRIKVLREEDAAAAAGEFSELAGLVSQPEATATPRVDWLVAPAIAAEPSSEQAPVVPVMAVQPDPIEPAAVIQTLEEIVQPIEPPVQAVEVVLWEPEVVELAAAAELPTAAEPFQAAEPPAAACQDTELTPLAVDTEEAVPEARTNVVEMPVSRPAEVQAALGRPAESRAELAIPGGFHEADAFVRLLEEDLPFTGLALALSVVDYVRLLADQGKPAMEQLMASVTRLVMSLAREQDFACRISEDEFILVFGRETGAAAKRRIQLVSERLWDFQLRSLGSVSVIFSWGAAESHSQPVVHAVENAREQMQETRRNRRALSSLSSRFRRRTATD